MATDINPAEVAYFQHRLQTAAQTQLPGTTAVDLARSPLGNDALAQAATQFGAPLSANSNGWGLSSFMSHLVSTKPDTIKAGDLSAIQQKLIDSGHLSPGTQPTGVWDPSSESAFTQWEQAQSNDFYAGHHPLATTTQKALMTLGWMLPSKVFQGIVGAAKGFVTETPQVVETLGAAGGAVAGATIGAAAGSVVPVLGTALGAAGGAIIGGAAGFLGDLLHHDEGDQSFSQAAWDALTPYDEYKGAGGAQKFWQDLSWITTAAALVTGVAGGVKAAAEGIATTGEAAAGEGTDFLTQALAKAPPAQPGWAARIFTTPVKYLGADKYAQVNDFFRTQGFIAQASRPIIKDIITPAFTGVASAQFAARAVSNLGQGDVESPLAKAIREAPLPQGPLGTLLDSTAFVIQPTQWLPWKLGDLSRGFQSIAESDQAFEPFVNVVRAKDPTLSREAAYIKARDALGSTPAEQASVLTAMHVEHGLESATMKRVQELGGYGREDPLYASISNDLRQKMIEEQGSSNPLTGSSKELEATRAISAHAGKPSLLKTVEGFQPEATNMPVTREVMSYAFPDPFGLDGTKGPAAFEAYLTRLTDAGSGPENFGNYFKATQAGKAATDAVRADPNIAFDTEGKIMSPGVITGPERTKALDLQNQADRLKRDIAKQSAMADSADPTVALQVKQDLRKERAQLKKLNDAIKSYNRKPSATWEDKLVVPARADTPTNGTYMDWWAQLDDLQARVKTQYKGLGDATTSAGLEQAKNARNAFLEEHQDHIPAKMYEKALIDNTGSEEVQNHFQMMSRVAAQDVVLPPEHMQPFDAVGYKPVVIHQRNSFEYAVDPRVLEATGINDYTRRGAFFDSIGLGVGKNSDAAIAKLRAVNTERLLDQLSSERNWGFSGRKLISRLYTGVQQSNSEGAITNDAVRGLRPIEAGGVTGAGGGATVKAGFIIPSKGGLSSIRHMAMDIRDLRPGDVMEAMKDLPNFSHSDAVAMYGALQQGGALGAEVNFLHSPVATMNEIGRVLRVNGFQGFSDLARQWHLQEPGNELAGISYNAKRLALTTGGGAALGAFLSDGKGDRLGDTLRGAGIGLATGLGVEMLAKRSYGFLPDYLHKVAMALRYSLSPSFDVRRFVKQNLLASTTHELPPVFKAKSYVRNREWASLYKDGGSAVTGDEAWSEALKLLDSVHGGASHAEDLDAFERTLYAGGITGYSPLTRQAAHAYMLAHKGYSETKIASALKDIYSYGIGRSALEKSANFVFFPFSFEKKVLTALGDFTLQNPGRSLLIYEGAKRFYQSTYATDVQDLLQKHVPFLEQLKEFNAFSHGLSPGRFFLEGVVGSKDEQHRTNTGKAAQILANFFIPGGGAMTPMQEAVGGIGDLAAHAFSPVVVTGQSMTRMGGGLQPESALSQLEDLAGKYIPLMKDLNELWVNAQDQAIAATHGESMSSQLDDYYSQQDRYKSSLAPMAYALGYTSPDGLLASQAGAPLKAQSDELKYQLKNKYPDAYLASTKFEDTQSLRDKALQDVLHSSDTSSAFDTIRKIAATQQQFDIIGQATGNSQVFDSLAASEIRTLALQHAEDPRFAELWQQIFEPTYGPIRLAVA